MSDLRATLERGGIPTELSEFVCQLVDLQELEDSLPAPYASVTEDYTELIWEVPPNRLRLRIHQAGRYRYWCENITEGLIQSDEVRRRALIQTLRNLVDWLLSCPG